MYLVQSIRCDCIEKILYNDVLRIVQVFPVEFIGFFKSI